MNMNLFLFTDDLVLRDLLAKQITHLNVDIKGPSEVCSEIVRNIYGLIISLCKNLIVLHFCDMFITRQSMTIVLLLPRASIICSTLIKLKIRVESLVDCLCLLDGRLESLSTLFITARQIFDPIMEITDDVSHFSMVMLKDKFVFVLAATLEIKMFFIDNITRDNCL